MFVGNSLASFSIETNGLILTSGSLLNAAQRVRIFAAVLEPMFPFLLTLTEPSGKTY